MVKNWPPNSGDTSSVPGLRSKIPHAPGQLNLQVATRECCMPQLPSHLRVLRLRKKKEGRAGEQKSPFPGCCPVQMNTPSSTCPSNTPITLNTHVYMHTHVCMHTHAYVSAPCFNPPRPNPISVPIPAYLKMTPKTQLSRKGSSSHMSQLGKGESCQPQRHKCQARSRATSKRTHRRPKWVLPASCISEKEILQLQCRL